MKALTRAEAECLLASIDLIWDPETLHERFKGHDRATFWRAVGKLRDVVAGRESGGSLPEASARAARIFAANHAAPDVDAPVLNKSGGSNVPEKMRTYHRKGYYSDAPCGQCGAAGGETCR